MSNSKRNKLTILLNDAKIMNRDGVAIPPHLLDEIGDHARNYAMGRLSEIREMMVALLCLRDENEQHVRRVLYQIIRQIEQVAEQAKAEYAAELKRAVLRLEGRIAEISSLRGENDVQ